MERRVSPCLKTGSKPFLGSPVSYQNLLTRIEKVDVKVGHNLDPEGVRRSETKDE